MTLKTNLKLLTCSLAILLCLTAGISGVCANDDMITPSISASADECNKIVIIPVCYTDPRNLGYLHVYCPVDNASVVLKYHDHTRNLTSSFSKSNGYYLVVVQLNRASYTIDSLNVSADGYYSQNFTSDELILPTEKFEVVNMTVNLKPISAQSPAPLVGIIAGFIVAGIFIERIRHNKK